MRSVVLLLLLLPYLAFSQFPDDDSIRPVLKGKYIVYKSNTGYFGIKDKDSNVLVQPQYVNITEIDEGLIIIKANKSKGFERSYSSGFMNKSLKLILPCNYRNIYSSGNGMLIACQNTDSKYGLVDTLGRIRIPFSYQDIGFFGDGLFPVKQDNLYGFLNQDGKVEIPFHYAFAHPFSEGKAGVKINGYFGFIDKRGKLALDAKYDEVGSFKNGFASVKVYGLTSIIDHNGIVQFPFIFESIDCVGDGLFTFRTSDKMREALPNLVKRDLSKPKLLASAYKPPTSPAIVDSILDYEEDQSPQFEGLLDKARNLPGGSDFYKVNFLCSRNGQSFFAVQSKTEVEKTDNWNFALMNGEGKILTAFDYFEMKFDGQIIIGQKEKETEIQSFSLDDNGQESE